MIIGIGSEDAPHLSVARDIIAAGVDALVDVFYRHLFAFPELMRGNKGGNKGVRNQFQQFYGKGS